MEISDKKALAIAGGVTLVSTLVIKKAMKAGWGMAILGGLLAGSVGYLVANAVVFE